MSLDHLRKVFESAGTGEFDYATVLGALLSTSAELTVRGETLPESIVVLWAHLALNSQEIRTQGRLLEWLWLSQEFLDAGVEAHRAIVLRTYRAVAPTIEDGDSVVAMSELLARHHETPGALDLLEELPSLCSDHLRYGIPSAWRRVIKLQDGAKRDRATAALKRFESDPDEAVRIEARAVLQILSTGIYKMP